MLFGRRCLLPFLARPSAALVFSLVALLLLSPSADKTNQADAAAFQTDMVACSNITDSESDTTFEVCAIGGATSPSPAVDENGTTVYLGGYSDSFDIAPGYAEGDRVPGDFVSLMTVETSLDDDGNCQVRVLLPEAIDFADCDSCTHCDDDGGATTLSTLYSADCTNLPNGRSVTCEPSSLGDGDVFFPLTAAALPDAGPVDPVVVDDNDNTTDANTNDTMLPDDQGGTDDEDTPQNEGGPSMMNPEDNDNSPPENNNNNNAGSAAVTVAAWAVPSVLLGAAVTASLY